MLSWPNSPLLVILHFFDSDELFGEEYDALEKDEGVEVNSAPRLGRYGIS